MLAELKQRLDNFEKSIRLQKANSKKDISRYLDLTKLTEYSRDEINMFFRNCHLKFEYILDFLFSNYKDKKVTILNGKEV